MPVVKMQKLALLAHRSLREELLEFLQDRGVLEVCPNEETTDIDHPEVLFQEAEVRYAIDYLKPHATEEIQKKMRMPSTIEEVRRSALHTDFRSIIDDCKKLQERLTTVKTKTQQLLSLQQQLQPWIDLPLPGNRQQNAFAQVEIILGSCPAASTQAFIAALHKRDSGIDVQILREEAGTAFLACFVLKNGANTFREIASDHRFQTITLPDSEKTPLQQLRQISVDLRLCEGNEKEITRMLATLAKKLPDLVNLAQFLHWMDLKQNVRSEISQTEQTIALQGWIQARDLPRLIQDLGHRFPAAAVMPLEPNEGEDPPIQIFNRNAVAPFEAVTRLYGLPQEGEMDPTRPLAPFFIFSFALCLTDAGYGMALALMMALAIWKFGLSRQNAKLVWLLLYSGIVTFFVSIPFGGWFGIVPEAAPAWATYVNSAGQTRFLGQIWDIQKEVDFFRNLALSIGAIQILFGIFLAGMWKWIHGKRWEAVTSHFSVHLFVIILALQIMLKMDYLQWPLIAVGALFVWGQGSGSWFVRPIIGALATVSFLIGLMSNILSYLRILALGLATGALAFAINQIASVISSLLPTILGVIAFIMIVLMGHLVSIALNSLGSFVHSGRLQFIEFFSQFFKGGGREFSPFRKTIRSVS